MNIFVLDEDPKLAAIFCLDKHIVKMPLETAQILCTVAYKRGFDAPYKPTHQSHPVTLWTGKSSANWNWLCDHGLALSKEYTARYKKTHKCETIIRNMQQLTSKIWKDNLLAAQHTPFEQCMPDQYKRANAVDAYRAYYIGEKSKFATWKMNKPSWFITNNHV